VNTDKMQWTVLEPAKVVWANDWIKILGVPVRLPTGVETQFYMMDAPDGVAVLAVDDQRRAILTRQYRPALGKIVLELPAGQVETGEPHSGTGLREVAEETGIHIKDMQYLGSFYRNPAKDTGSMHVYFARAAGLASPQQERFECLEPIRVPIDDLFARILNYEIQDVTTVFAALMLRSRLENGDIQL
jgi:ADP-ribose pyrophosphatase